MFHQVALPLVVVGPAEGGLDFGEEDGEVKGLGDEIVRPMLMAMTILMLSEAEDKNRMGTWETRRISWHQWYPL